MSETFRTLHSGGTIGSDGEQAMDAKGDLVEIRYVSKRINHAEIITLQSSPVEIVATTGTTSSVCVVAWNVSINDGTAYITNTDVVLTNSLPTGPVLGAATAVLAETSAITVQGSILSGLVVPNDGLFAAEGGGTPANGDSSRFIVVRVMYYITHYEE